MKTLSNSVPRARVSALALLAFAAAASTFLPSARGFPSVFPTGVTRYDPKLAYNGYVVFAGNDGRTHVIDMNGNEVHTWDHAGQPSEILDPKLTGGKPGHVVLKFADGETGNGGEFIPGRQALSGGTLAELDWDNKLVWQSPVRPLEGPSGQHHDWDRLTNGNTLILGDVLHPVAGFTTARIKDDSIYEVTPDGKVVWEWISSDHLEEFGFTAEQLTLIRNTAPSDYLHLNDMHALGANHWFDAGDTRFNPENIIIDSRNANFIAIIDKKTGKVVWNLGPNLPTYSGARGGGGGAGRGGAGVQGGRGGAGDVAATTSAPGSSPASRTIVARLPRPVDQTSGQHNAHIIAAGLPGAGNILVFDNQGEGGYPPAPLAVDAASRVIEIDPIKKEIVWEYAVGYSFYSGHISSAHRLPNGNTLIDEGITGRLFQVTAGGDIVWEYVSPYVARSALNGRAGGNAANASSAQATIPGNNSIYRAQIVPYDWVPAGTPHSEVAVIPPALATYRVPAIPAANDAASPIAGPAAAQAGPRP